MLYLSEEETLLSAAQYVIYFIFPRARTYAVDEKQSMCLIFWIGKEQRSYRLWVRVNILRSNEFRYLQL